MLTTIYDIAFEIRDDDFVQLEQDAGCGEVSRIDLHTSQLRLLAERAGLLAAPDPRLIDRLSARHVSRIRALHDRLEEFFSVGYGNEIIERCGYGLEVMLHMRAISDLVHELVEDIGGDAPVDADVARESHENSQSNDKSDVAIPVTPPRKRGRPATGKALSDAERQARHRARTSTQELTLTERTTS